MIKGILALALAAYVSAGEQDPRHQYTPQASKSIADSIKTKLLENIGGFANTDFAKKLEADLKEEDDSKRQLKEIDAISANQIFSVLKLDDPNCDKNQDGVIKGEELKCLNYIWKAYLPQ